MYKHVFRNRNIIEALDFYEFYANSRMTEAFSMLKSSNISVNLILRVVVTYVA